MDLGSRLEREWGRDEKILRFSISNGRKEGDEHRDETEYHNRGCWNKQSKIHPLFNPVLFCKLLVK